MKQLIGLLAFCCWGLIAFGGEGKPVMIFRHGSDWNKAGETILNNAWKGVKADKALQARWNFGTFNEMEAPTEAAKKNNAPVANLGKASFYAYPALSLHNGKGQCYAVFDALPYNITTDELKAKIEEARAVYDKVEREWQKAGTLSGAKKAEALAKGLIDLEPFYSIGGLKDDSNFGWVVKEIGNADPQDATGYRWRFNFNADGYTYRIQGLIKDKKFSEAEQIIEGELSKPGYKNLAVNQQQALQLLRFVLYKDDNSKRSEMISLLKKVYAMDPTTHFGEGAAGYLRMWGECPAIAIPYGWNKNFCKTGKNTWEILMGVRKNFRNSEFNYRVTFVYGDGSSPLQIRKVELREGDKVLVAAAEKPQALTARGQEARFTLKWSEGKPVKNPMALRLFVEYESKGNDSNGQILVAPLFE